jgi:ankyrin repeat protein
VNVRDPEGRTALMLAVVNGKAGAVKVLLAHHANPNIADAKGTTPLRAALTNRQAKIFDLLSRAGAH